MTRIVFLSTHGKCNKYIRVDVILTCLIAGVSSCCCKLIWVVVCNELLSLLWLSRPLSVQYLFYTILSSGCIFSSIFVLVSSFIHNMEGAFRFCEYKSFCCNHLYLQAPILCSILHSTWNISETKEYLFSSKLSYITFSFLFLFLFELFFFNNSNTMTRIE